ncbi:DUF58 domain-containing protein [Persicirhabdus sediminis]|uniref:DUF58 domain-containing protein n=1 Tax=Persicirhabdus sediminis TaxID=454144 RepID=A0A8J7MEC2_9BACT|nr:DUF58 domain-containing protein [Persicirhabdus sediminis]MBK1791721.1 DUF58 domain-containing protein [Persicirhabdus sediminis]
MTIDDLQLALENAQAASQHLALPLAGKNWSGPAGEFAGSGTGSSIDFHDQRDYHPGDDPRHINWQAYARNGSYTMKLYREEVRPLVELIVDVTPSMFLTKQKAMRSCEMIYLLHALAEKSGSAVQIYLLHGDHHLRVERDQLASHAWFEKVANFSSKQKKTAEADGPSLPRVDHLPLRAKSFRLILTDGLYLGDPTSWLHQLARGQGVMSLFIPYCSEEENPAWRGNCNLKDTEQGRDHQVHINPKQLDAYKTAYNNHFSLWQQCAQKFQAPLARIPAELSLIESLQLQALPKQALSTNS